MGSGTEENLASSTSRSLKPKISYLSTDSLDAQDTAGFTTQKCYQGEPWKHETSLCYHK